MYSVMTSCGICLSGKLKLYRLLPVTKVQYLAVLVLYAIIFAYSVDIMASKLDSENLGIITQSSFFEEFYAGETIPEVPKSFKLYHYNGLARSCADNKVGCLHGHSRE